MDVYQKVLTKIFQDCRGRETEKVDMGEILKKEGFYANRDQITDHLVTEGWVTETDHKFVVKITHWGVAAAKKALSDAPDNSRAIEKDSKRLIQDAKELAVMAEEFASEPSADRLKLIEKRHAELGSVVSRLRTNLQ